MQKEPGKSETYYQADLRILLHHRPGAVDRVPTYSDEERLSDKDTLEQRFADVARVQIANKALHKRGLIDLQSHAERGVVLITLQMAGYDLGIRYCSRLDRSGLWFAHYKDHWVWFFTALIGGAVIGEVVRALTS